MRLRGSPFLVQLRASVAGQSGLSAQEAVTTALIHHRVFSKSKRDDPSTSPRSLSPATVLDLSARSIQEKVPHRCPRHERFEDRRSLQSPGSRGTRAASTSSGGEASRLTGEPPEEQSAGDR